MLSNILVTGSGGNLGRYFCENSFYKNGLHCIQRNDTLSSDFTISPGRAIRLPDNYKPSLIINFANAYFPSANPTQVEIMRSAIVGVSESISETSSIHSIPVISFSSHFQYPPLQLRPWSAYSELKDESVQILETRASSFVEITLRDNYGGLRRDKFFDLALLANKLGTNLDANQGDSLLNLSHVSDLCRGIDSVISQLDAHKAREHFELKNHNTYTLRELVALIDSTTNRKTSVKWGVMPYREKEVFTDWECAPAPFNWKPEAEIEDYIHNFNE